MRPNLSALPVQVKVQDMQSVFASDVVKKLIRGAGQ
jgi:hypothetical protein